MKKLLTVFLLLFVVFTACKDDATEPIPDASDIPGDPGIAVPTTSVNNVQPTANFQVSPTNSNRVQVNLQGVQNPLTNTPITFNYNAQSPGASNIFIAEDGVVKGLKVTKVSTGNVLQADVVFTVDNSGSMGQESDSIAASIIEFADFLVANGLDVRFGIVGYSGNVTGALNFTNSTTVRTYLSERMRWGSPINGTARTVGFYGADSATLDDKAGMFAPGVWGENGAVGVFFADSNFSWRSSAQRVFINFTDEPNQAATSGEFDLTHIANQISGKATIHTVFSRDTTFGSYSTLNQRPWKMSDLTGGTSKFISSDASGLNLSTLPVAGTLANSYLLEFLKSNAEVKNRVIKVIIVDQGVDGEKTYNWTY